MFGLPVRGIPGLGSPAAESVQAQPAEAGTRTSGTSAIGGAGGAARFNPGFRVVVEIAGGQLLGLNRRIDMSLRGSRPAAFRAEVARAECSRLRLSGGDQRGGVGGRGLLGANFRRLRGTTRTERGRRVRLLGRGHALGGIGQRFCGRRSRLGRASPGCCGRGIRSRGGRAATVRRDARWYPTSRERWRNQGRTAAESGPGTVPAPAARESRRAHPAAPHAATAAADLGTWSCATPIQVVLGDVLNDTIGHQIPNRKPPTHPASTVRGGYRQRRHFKRAYALLWQTANGEGVSWPRNCY